MLINESQVALRKGGNYLYLNNFLNRRKVVPAPFLEIQKMVITDSTSVMLITNVTGNIAVNGKTSLAGNGEYIAANVPGFVPGTKIASTNIDYDDYGNIVNLINIRNEESHDPLIDYNGRKIYGLVQTCAADIAPINWTNGEENLQISFIVNNDGIIELTELQDISIEFQLNRVYSERNTPAYTLSGGVENVEILADKNRDLVYIQDINPTKTVNPRDNGSLWINYITSQIYICKDNSADNNKWIPVNHDIIIKGDINQLSSKIIAEFDLDEYKYLDLSFRIERNDNRGFIKIALLYDSNFLSKSEYLQLGSVEGYNISFSIDGSICSMLVSNEEASSINYTLRCNNN